MKILGYIFVILVGLTTVAYLYIFKWQTIDTLTPPEFTYCGSQIWGSNPKYVEITQWLKNNKDDWDRSYASYVPGVEYRTGSYQINVLSNTVVVSYKTDYGFPQFVKQINHGLEISCNGQP